jgi:CrcB protein
MSRWAVGEAIPAPGGWPLATLMVNLAGALALGALLETLARRGADVGPRRLVRLTVGTGFLGAFTTYSALAVDGARLFSATRAGDGVWYLALTLLGGAAATLLGVAGAAWLHREDRRGLAAEAHVAAHPHGGHPAAGPPHGQPVAYPEAGHPHGHPHGRPEAGLPLPDPGPGENTLSFGQDPGLQTGVSTETQGRISGGPAGPDRTGGPDRSDEPDGPDGLGLSDRADAPDGPDGGAAPAPGGPR